MLARARVSPHKAAADAARSHGVVENNILLGQLQQHGIIEELADAHILAQALQSNHKPGLFLWTPVPMQPSWQRSHRKALVSHRKSIFQARQEDLQGARCYSADNT